MSGDQVMEICEPLMNLRGLLKEVEAIEFEALTMDTSNKIAFEAFAKLVSLFVHKSRQHAKKNCFCILICIFVMSSPKILQNRLF